MSTDTDDDLPEFIPEVKTDEYLYATPPVLTMLGDTIDEFDEVCYAQASDFDSDDLTRTTRVALAATILASQFEDKAAAVFADLQAVMEKHDIPITEDDVVSINLYFEGNKQ